MVTSDCRVGVGVRKLHRSTSAAGCALSLTGLITARLRAHLVRSFALGPAAFDELPLFGIFYDDHLYRECSAPQSQTEPTKIFYWVGRAQLSSIARRPACDPIQRLERPPAYVAPGAESFDDVLHRARFQNYRRCCHWTWMRFRPLAMTLVVSGKRGHADPRYPYSNTVVPIAIRTTLGSCLGDRGRQITENPELL
jgi:hypothetical protein